jgi:methionyl-tRNA formyltransferase
MRVLIIGRTEILYQTTLELAKEHEIAGIISAKAAAEYLKTERDFENLANELKAQFILTNRISDETNDLINSLKPDIGVSMNWVSIIKKNTLNLFPKGILNVHFADLPRFRGNAAANWAIIRNEKYVPLTIHYMVPGELDSGDILMQHRIKVSRDTTIGDIYNRAFEVVPQMFSDVLNRIEKGKVKRIAQSLRGKKGFRCFPRVPRYSRIDWNLPASKIHALVKASTRPFSGAYTYMRQGNGKIAKVYIWKSRIVANKTADIGVPGHIIRNDAESGESWVYTGKGILAIGEVSYDNEELFQPGKKWKSIRMGFGVDVEEELMALRKEIEKMQ